MCFKNISMLLEPLHIYKWIFNKDFLIYIEVKMFMSILMTVFFTLLNYKIQKLNAIKIV